MENNLERYKSVIRTQNTAFAAALIILVAVITLSFCEVIKPFDAGEKYSSMYNGFIGGLAMAFGVICIFGFIMNTKALKNEDKLRKMYIKANDERMKAISLYAGHNSYWFEVLGLLLGIIIGGLFSPVIAAACLGCLFYVCFVRLGLKIYYSRKM